MNGYRQVGINRAFDFGSYFFAGLVPGAPRVRNIIQQSAISNQQSAISNQQSAISNQNAQIIA